MRALRWHGRLDVRLDDVAPPRARGAGEVLLEVLYCGICGTDLEEFRQGPRLMPFSEPHPLTGAQAPLTLGHEFVGRVVETGPGVTGVAPGDILAVDGNRTCGVCFWCRNDERTLCPQIAQYGLKADGGLAEQVVVEVGTCVLVPPDADLRIGALAEPVSVAVRAVRRSRLEPGERIVVVGGGPIGLLVVEVARAMGAAWVGVVDPRQERRELAERVGADAAFDSVDDIVVRVEAGTCAPGPDVVFECAGQPTTAADAVGLVRRGGRVVLVTRLKDLRLDASFTAGEKELIAALTHDRSADFETAVDLMVSGRVAAVDIVTHELTLESAAYSIFSADSDFSPAGKALVTSNRAPQDRVPRALEL